MDNILYQDEAWINKSMAPLIICVDAKGKGG